MLTRRQFIWTVGGGAATLTLGPLAYSKARGGARRKGPRIPLARTEAHANSICPLCPLACGVRLRLVNGNPVSVAGNPLHPVNRGGLCARGAAALQLYYDPDRFAGPRRRDPGLVGGWSPTPWNEAVTRVADRVRYAVEAGPGRVAVIRGHGRDIASQLLGRLAGAARSDWVVDLAADGERLGSEVVRLLHGVAATPLPDLANARFLLLCESDLLESATSTMTLHRGFAAARSAGARVVHAAPRLGVTGSKADDWLPIRPGTGGVLALGVAHMLIKEGFTDEAFLATRMVGFDEWKDEQGVTRPGLRSWILREFAPQRVAEITGVGWDRIIRAARAFGESPRPLAIGPLGAATPHQLFDLAAAHALNAIAGSIDVPGGVLIARRPPVEPLDAPPASDTVGQASGGGRTLGELASWVLEGREPGIDVCFVHDADPVFSSLDGARVAEALRKIPLVVATSPVATDTTACADVVLPDAVAFERRADSFGVDGGGFPFFASSPPALKALAEGRDAADVALAVAAKAGPRIAEQFPWKSHEEALRDRVGALHQSRLGDAFSDAHRATWSELLERSGWRTASYTTVEELAARIDETGGWWDPAYHHGEWRRVFPREGNRMDLRPLPSLVEPGVFAPAAAAAQGALELCAYPEPALATHMGGSLPYLQDLASPLSEFGWVTVAEVNPETLRQLGLAHGRRATLANDRGELTVVLRTSPAIRPGVVAVPIGGGRKEGGRYAAGIGENPLRLFATRPEARTRAPRPERTFVRVREVG